MRFAASAGLGLCLVLAAASVARATCDPTTDPDKTDIANARAAVAANCDCAGATSAGAYKSCAAQQADTTLVNKTCARVVKRCAARSTCGRPSAVTCCVTKTTGTKCKIKRDAAHCTAPAGATACVGSYASCCDACSAGSCATATTTTTSSTTTTTTTTPRPCGGNPQYPSCNGTCDPGMGCAYSQPLGACRCVPDDTCRQTANFCFVPATGDCSHVADCPPGYGCTIEPGGAVCLGPSCGPGCFCPQGGACAVFR
jgi:hypothetical protein